MKYQKRPEEVEAFKLSRHKKPDWYLRMVEDERVIFVGGVSYIKTKKGYQLVNPTDWIIKDGDLARCVRMGDFEAAYMPVDAEPGC